MLLYVDCHLGLGTVIMCLFIGRFSARPQLVSHSLRGGKIVGSKMKSVLNVCSNFKIAISCSQDLRSNIRKMSLKRKMMYAMTKTEKVAHNRNVLRIRQKRWRDKRKKVLKLLSVENLPLYTNHRLGKVVHSILGEKAKARKRRKIQFNKISKNPDLLAEKRHKDS